MTTNTLLIDAARRPVEAAAGVLDAISSETLHAMPEGRCNSIAWLVWHAARQQDVQVAELAGSEQVWVSGDWATRTGLNLGPDAMGFGDGPAEVARIKVGDPAPLRAYLEAAVARTVDYIEGLDAQQLSEIIDRRWDPPVTRGVRLVSVIDDAVVHLGQAAYVRGLVEGWSIGY